MEQKIYLGDGAYAEIKGATLHLTAENGISATDRVVLEPDMVDTLLAFLERAREERIWL